ncbi:MAG: hypothetical protein K1X74_03225 [Pirellulales bacterium]|nr:hypothetical protein [Pirellulales bacterium]
MSKPHWLSSLSKDLVRQGLPPAYARRVAGELRDHRADLLRRHSLSAATSADALASAERELGSPEELTARILHEYRARHFAGRHPRLTFLVAPVPLVLAIAAVEVVTLALMLQGLSLWPGDQVLGELFNSGGLLSMGAIVAGSALLCMTPPLIVAWLLCRWANSARVSRRLLFGGLALTALVAALIQTYFGPGGNGPDGIGWQLQFGFSLSEATLWRHLAQLLLPLSLAALYLRLTAGPGRTQLAG